MYLKEHVFPFGCYRWLILPFKFCQLHCSILRQKVHELSGIALLCSPRITLLSMWYCGQVLEISTFISFCFSDITHKAVDTFFHRSADFSTIYNARPTLNLSRCDLFVTSPIDQSKWFLPAHLELSWSLADTQKMHGVVQTTQSKTKYILVVTRCSIPLRRWERR